MLIKLTPSQITTYSNLIVRSVEESMPPYTYSSYMKTNHVLESLMSGFMQCWFIYNQGKKTEVDISIEPLGIMVTSILPDFYTKTTNLLIYSLFGIHKITPDIWIDGITTLKKFAKDRGCFRVIAYSDIPNIISIVKKLGGDTSITFISIEVE